MKIRIKNSKQTLKATKRIHFLRLFCWIIIPIAIISFLILDGLGIYAFNTERLIVIGACIFVILIPFFNEITVKNISVKRDKEEN